MGAGIALGSPRKGGIASPTALQSPAVVYQGQAQAEASGAGLWGMQTQSDACFYFKCHGIREATCLPQHAQQKAVGLQGHGIAWSPDEVQPEEGKSSKNSSGFWPGFQDPRPSVQRHQNAPYWNSSNPAPPTLVSKMGKEQPNVSNLLKIICYLVPYPGPEVK